MADNKLNEIIQTSLENIRELADVNTIIGERITTPNGTVIIPVSKVSLGFVTGGVDYGKKDKDKKAKPVESSATVGGMQNAVASNNFGGGGGTGISVQPVGFLVIKPDGDVEMLNISSTEKAGQAADIAETVSGLIEKSPSIIQKIKETFSKNKDKGNNGGEEANDGEAAEK